MLKSGTKTQDRAASRSMLREVAITSVTALHGCNKHHTKTVMELSLDISSFAGARGSPLPRDFHRRFSERFLGLPSLIDRPVRTAEFCKRLGMRTPATTPGLAEIVLEAIVAVENAASAMMYRLDSVEFTHVVSARQSTSPQIVWSTRTATFSKLCAQTAIAGINELLQEPWPGLNRRKKSPFEDYFSELRQLTLSRRLTTTVSVIREAAKSRGIPFAYVGGSYLRLGDGKYQTYFRGSITGRTSHAASQLSIDKRLATKTLRAQRLPVPRQVRVRSAEAAPAAAAKIGLPVIVKPMKGHGGAGVSVVRAKRELAAAYRRAAAVGPEVAIEEFIRGHCYRLLVVDGKFNAALKIALPEVKGDGVRSVRALVEELNSDPLRDGFRHVAIDLDKELVAYISKQGVELDTVLDAGRTLPLRAIANVARGSCAVDVTDEVHRDNVEIAERAARAIGLDIAGVDMISKDISRSHRTVGGKIIEINGRPGLGMHVWPSEGKSRDVGKAALDVVFPEGSRSTVSSAVVIGDRSTAVVARDLDGLLRDSGRSAGLAIRSNAFVNGSRRELGVRTSARAVRTLLRDPEVEWLVFTRSTDHMVTRGLILDTVDVAAVVEPTDKADKGAYEGALDVLFRAAPGAIVINASNPLTSNILEEYSSNRVIVVEPSGMTAQVRHHVKTGGQAVIAKWVGSRRHIEFFSGGKVIKAWPVTGRPLGEKGAARDHEAAARSTGTRSLRLEPRLFAIGLAAALGTSFEKIGEALSNAPLSIR